MTDPLHNPALWTWLWLPDTTVALASLGICLVFVEFNRPGSILPGALGGLLLLLGTAHLLRLGLRPLSAALLLVSAVLLLANLARELPLWSVLAGTLAAIASLRFLLAPRCPRQVGTPVAILCGGCMGVLTALLARVAYRARRAKALD